VTIEVPETRSKAVDEDDDCVAIEEPTELIEIKDDDEDPEKSCDVNKPNDLKRQLPTTASSPSPLKIKKIESLNTRALSPGHYSESSNDAELPRCVENYKDALRLLKPLEEFALLEENYRAIGLLTQLEKIFESGARSAHNANSSK